MERWPALPEVPVAGAADPVNPSARKLLHAASVFPSNSNRLALQCDYARDGWSIALLHLAARPQDVEGELQGIDEIHILPHVPRHRTEVNYLMRRLRSLVRRVVNTLALCVKLIRSDADVMHAHENSSLWPLAFWVLALRRPAVWDPHDYFHEPAGNDGDSSRLSMLKSLERKIVRRRTPILAVSDGMKEKYANLYPDASIAVIRNYSSTRNSQPVEPYDADTAATGLIAERDRMGRGMLRLVYPGLIKRERFTLDLVRVLGNLDGLSLDIYGEDRSGLAAHHSALERTLVDHGIDNVHLRGPYTSDGIVSILRQYHFAIFPYERSHPNIDFCLPNKFYQCVEAGLPLVTTDMKEMGGIIRQHGLGYVFPSGDNEACADILQGLSVDSDDYLDLVRNVLAYQATQVDYEQQRAALLDTYTRGQSAKPVSVR